MIGAVNMLVDLTDIKIGEEASAQLSVIVESSHDAIVSKDLDGIITSWNEGAEQLFGHTANEAIGNPGTILIPPDRSNEEPAILERIRRGELIESYESIRRCKDGSLIDVSLSVSPIKNAVGKVIGASKIVRDITDTIKSRKALEQLNAELRENEERYRTLFSHAPMDVFVCDQDAIIRDYNVRAVEIWGREPERGAEKHCGSVGLWRPDGSPLPHEQTPLREVLRTGIPRWGSKF